MSRTPDADEPATMGVVLAIEDKLAHCFEQVHLVAARVNDHTRELQEVHVLLMAVMARLDALGIVPAPSGSEDPAP